VRAFLPGAADGVGEAVEEKRKLGDGARGPAACVQMAGIRQPDMPTALSRATGMLGFPR